LPATRLCRSLLHAVLREDTSQRTGELFVLRLHKHEAKSVGARLLMCTASLSFLIALTGKDLATKPFDALSYLHERKTTGQKNSLPVEASKNKNYSCSKLSNKLVKTLARKEKFSFTCKKARTRIFQLQNFQ
jgi:hypothetical protein